MKMDLAGDTSLTSLALVVTLTFLVSIMVWKSISQSSKLPPGPFPLPFVGNILQLKGKSTVQSLLKLSKKYGPVFTIYFGSKPMLVLCGYETIKEALVDQGEDFGGRANLPALKFINKGYGVVFSNGERWKQLRRFTLTTLRNFGMGKRSLEERIQEEAQCLVQELRTREELPFDPTFSISKAVSNVICSVVFGERFDYKDERFLTLLRLFNEINHTLASFWGLMLNVFPSIVQCLPGPHNMIPQNIKTIRRFVKEYIKQHQETLDPCNPRDFIDCFLIKMGQEHLNPNSEFSMKNLVSTTFDLFAAGTETTGTTLRYGLMIFLKYPHIEDKVHQEIDHVIGQNRRPCWEDRSKMPYTEAVIHEIQRFIDMFPVDVPHKVMRDTTFRGFTIPKDMGVLPVLTSVLFDQKKFESPEYFDPKHFLDNNGNFKKSDGFVPFSTGKRMCLGEGLARMELFLFFTTILQNFNLKPVGKREDIDIAPEVSTMSNLPRAYQLHLIPR